MRNHGSHKSSSSKSTSASSSSNFPLGKFGDPQKPTVFEDDVVTGFTLIELAVSIVIIAIIMSSVLIGSAIVKNAKLQQIAKEWQLYSSAINNFKTVYDAIPGDMYNATSFFSGTTNGNGDNLVSGTGGTSYEEFTIWQHLELAGFIEGTFNGTTQVGVSQVNNNSWDYIVNSGNVYAAIPALTYNSLVYSAGCCWTLPGAISPIDAYSIDAKYDDGIAITGNIITAFAPANDCVRTSNGTGANVAQQTTPCTGCNYNMVETQPVCVMYFLAPAR